MCRVYSIRKTSIGKKQFDLLQYIQQFMSNLPKYKMINPEQMRKWVSQALFENFPKGHPEQL